MAYLALAAFVLVVACASGLSWRRGQRPAGCCAPADPDDDARMRAATGGDVHREPPRDVHERTQDQPG